MRPGGRSRDIEAFGLFGRAPGAIGVLRFHEKGCATIDRGAQVAGRDWIRRAGPGRGWQWLYGSSLGRRRRGELYRRLRLAGSGDAGAEKGERCEKAGHGFASLNGQLTTLLRIVANQLWLVLQNLVAVGEAAKDLRFPSRFFADFNRHLLRFSAGAWLVNVSLVLVDFVGEYSERGHRQRFLLFIR